MMVRLRFLVLVTLVAPPFGQRVTPPAEHLGRPVGGDFTLADWDEVSPYFRELDEQSPRVVTTRVGMTTEGREFLPSIIPSEANLASLERVRDHARTLADPRGASDAQKREAVDRGRVILFISGAMHATDCAGPQFAMEFADHLGTSDGGPCRSAREHLVVGVTPP
jgi:hypothetical protein